MHELSLAQNIIAIAREEMEKHHATVLSSIRLAVGKMSGVVPDSLAFCLELITQDTDLQGVKIAIDIIPMRFTCHGCHMEFESERFTAVCPHCGAADIIMISGRELSIAEMEVDDTGEEG